MVRNLNTWKTFSVLSVALLTKENRTTTIKDNSQRNYQQGWGENDNQKDGQQDIHSAFPG